jgi:phosphoribosyl 1,2-cyclic phosphodiesterase
LTAPLHLAVLGSGSSGNSILLEHDGFSLLIDAGLSALATKRRLADLGIAPDTLRAICVTHEHTDHTRGIAQLRKQYGVELYANLDTARAIDPDLPWYIFQDGSPFQVGPFRITPFALPHDAMDPVGYTVAAAGVTVGIATDLGFPTTLVRTHLSHCAAIVLETNHEPSLLRSSSYPPYLQQRILSRQGHLSNNAAAALAAEIASANPLLSHIFAAHLSRECNRPELALDALSRALRPLRPTISIHPTFPDHPSDLLTFP